MPYGLYISAEGAHAQSKRMEVIANNMANVDTVGFKRQLAIFQSRYAEAIDQGQASPGSGSINDLGGGVRMLDTATDFSAGSLVRTNIPTDLAFRREGYFLVRRGEENQLTRAGNFLLGQRGELLTQDGCPVLSESGSPVVVERPDQPWTITSTGDLQQGNAVQRLAIVKPVAASDMLRTGGNSFRVSRPPEPLSSELRDVAQGYVEASGVTVTTEMVEMLETSRMLEANLNMMQTQDQMLGNLVGRLLKV